MIAGDGILTASRRQYHNKPRPSDLSPFLSPNTISFIPRGAKTQKKRNHVISQMRLRGVLKMRMSI